MIKGIKRLNDVSALLSYGPRQHKDAAWATPPRTMRHFEANCPMLFAGFFTVRLFVTYIRIHYPALGKNNCCQAGARCCPHIVDYRTHHSKTSRSSAHVMTCLSFSWEGGLALH